MCCVLQKTLPVLVAVVEQLGGSLGVSGLLVLPCVAAHLNQVSHLLAHITNYPIHECFISINRLLFCRSSLIHFQWVCGNKKRMLLAISRLHKICLHNLANVGHVSYFVFIFGTNIAFIDVWTIGRDTKASLTLMGRTQLALF